MPAQTKIARLGSGEPLVKPKKRKARKVVKAKPVAKPTATEEPSESARYRELMTKALGELIVYTLELEAKLKRIEDALR